MRDYNRGAGVQKFLREARCSVAAAGEANRPHPRGPRAGDAVLLSPVFATRSHPGAPTIGPLRFARWVRESPIPVYALGGIDVPGARRLRHSGAAGFAAIGGLLPPSQPASASPA